MAVKLPDDPKQLKSLCERYQKQVKDLTQKCERENLNWGMEEYYLTQKIRDFEKLCENNKIDFSIVNELDKSVATCQVQRKSLSPRNSSCRCSLITTLMPISTM